LFSGPDEVKTKLDWKRRVKICLDVAKGLAYLHEDCNLKLIHGDIKPSNVLLDKDFNAKISDFGFAQTHEKSTKNARPDEGETTPTNTQVKGTQ
jgi:serine/threonine protein kinase